MNTKFLTIALATTVVSLTSFAQNSQTAIIEDFKPSVPLPNGTTSFQIIKNHCK